MLGDLKVADVQSTVELTFADDFQDYTRFTPSDPQDKNVTDMLDELVARGTALRGGQTDRGEVDLLERRG